MIYLGIASYSEEQKTEVDIDNLYMKGERFSDSAKFDESAEACMKIIQMGKTQEKTSGSMTICIMSGKEL